VAGNLADMTLATIAVGLAGLAVVFVIGKYYSESNTKDLGTMSEKWLAEHNASRL
jgi:hypothetical protein